MFSDTVAGIAPASVLMFVVMQLFGGALAYGLVRLLYPDAPGRGRRGRRREPKTVPPRGAPDE